MTVVAIVVVSSIGLAWLAVRRCPLARAIGCQVDQFAASSHQLP